MFPLLRQGTRKKYDKWEMRAKRYESERLL